jgi:hypothetical protein
VLVGPAMVDETINFEALRSFLRESIFSVMLAADCAFHHVFFGYVEDPRKILPPSVAKLSIIRV